jgi:hypothetical protein
MHTLKHKTNARDPKIKLMSWKAFTFFETTLLSYLFSCIFTIKCKFITYMCFFGKKHKDLMGFDILEPFVALGVDEVNKLLEFHKLL